MAQPKGRKRGRNQCEDKDQEEVVVPIAKRPRRHKKKNAAESCTTITKAAANVKSRTVVSLSPPSRLPSRVSTQPDPEIITHNKGKSSLVSRRLKSWSQKEEEENQNHQLLHPGNKTRSTNNRQNSLAESDNQTHTTKPIEYTYKRRRYQQITLIWIQTVLCFAVILFLLVSVMYTLIFSHNIQVLQMDSIHKDAIDKYTFVLQDREQQFQHTKSLLKKAESKAKQSQETIARIAEEMTKSDTSYKLLIEDYKAIAQQHDDDMKTALERIEALRSQKEESSSALDMAWLRMDELLQEHSELSSQLKLTKAQLRSRVESLTLQLNQLSQTKSVLEEYNKNLISQNDHQEQTLEYVMNVLFMPILVYALDLQHTSEHQHSIIVDLTSMVRSLKESLDNSVSDLDTQIVVAQMNTKVHEMERLSLVQSMEAQLERLEYEAVGAVKAVAEASGKLEFERKIEEETRWREYVSQVESILGDISSSADDGLHSRSDTSNNIMDGIVETSVLRAAISRRVEQGLTILKEYVHPHHFVKKKDGESLFNYAN
jgi:hypothetical protein